MGEKCFGVRFWLLTISHIQTQTNTNMKIKHNPFKKGLVNTLTTVLVVVVFGLLGYVFSNIYRNASASVPNITFRDSEIFAIEGDSNVEFIIQADKIAVSDIIVQINMYSTNSLANKPSVSPSDVTLISAVIPSGTRQGVAIFNIHDDTIIEPTEILRFSIATGTGYTIGSVFGQSSPHATLRVLDNDTEDYNFGVQPRWYDPSNIKNNNNEPISYVNNSTELGSAGWYPSELMNNWNWNTPSSGGDSNSTLSQSTGILTPTLTPRYVNNHDAYSFNQDRMTTEVPNDSFSRIRQVIAAVKFDNGASWYEQTLMSVSSSTTDDIFVISMPNNNLTIKLNGVSYPTGINLQDGQWHILDVSFTKPSFNPNIATLEVHIDSVHRFTQTMSHTSVNETAFMTIGMEQNGYNTGYTEASSFFGYLSDFAIFTNPLSPYHKKLTTCAMMEKFAINGTECNSKTVLHDFNANSLTLDNGADVSSWPNATNTANFSSVSNQSPTMVTNWLGSNKALRFDGTDDLYTGNFDISGRSQSIVTVGQPNIETNNPFYFNNTNAAGSNFGSYFGTSLQRTRSSSGIGPSATTPVSGAAPSVFGSSIDLQRTATTANLNSASTSFGLQNNIANIFSEGEPKIGFRLNNDVVATSTITNTVTASSQNYDSNSSNNSASVNDTLTTVTPIPIWGGDVSRLLIFDEYLADSELRNVNEFLELQYNTEAGITPFNLALGPSKHISSVGGRTVNGERIYTPRSQNLGGAEIIANTFGYVRTPDYFTIGRVNEGTKTLSTSNLPSGVLQRWGYEWAVENDVVPRSATIRFDMSQYLGGTLLNNSTNYVLLYRDSQASNYSIASSDDVLKYNDVIEFTTSIFPGYYTLGTTSTASNPLGPIPTTISSLDLKDPACTPNPQAINISATVSCTFELNGDPSNSYALPNGGIRSWFGIDLISSTVTSGSSSSLCSISNNNTPSASLVCTGMSTSNIASGGNKNILVTIGNHAENSGTFAVRGFSSVTGTITIDAPLTATLNTISVSDMIQTSCGTLNNILIEDTRGGAPGWTLTLSSADFANGQTIIAIANALEFEPTSAIGINNEQSPTLGNPRALTSTSDTATLASTSIGNGLGEYHVSTNVCLDVPPYTQALSYQAVMTSTVV